MLRNLKRQPTDYVFEEPIRDEIFSPERLEQYALYLANELSISVEPSKGRSLLPRVEENFELLKGVYKKLTISIQSGFTISPAAEWLIDNFHIIEDQVREIKEDLPEKYYGELPKITIGDLANYPRVYGIALTLVAHQDSHIDIETLKRFIKQYQTISPLYIGEVWAVAIALRIALVENLRRLAIHIVHAQEIKEWADNYADHILEFKDLSQENLEFFHKEIQKKLTDSKLDDCSLIVHLSRKLRDQTSSVMSICDCLDQHIACKNLNMDQIVHLEYQRQAAAQVTVSNIINSMRLLSNIDWQDFFESVNLIDPILDQDPSRAYQKMDFASRDRYRHTVERIQKKTDVSEIEVAKTALHLAKKSVKIHPKDLHKHHVGYYLIENGIESLEKKISYQPTFGEVLKRCILNRPTTFYMSTLFSLTSLILAPLLIYAYFQNAIPISLILIAMIALIPISDSCLNLLNLLVTRFLKPRILAKLDLDKFTSDLPKAFVVVPTIFSCKEAAEKMLDSLEIRYLANQDENLYFALLSDFTDSDSESQSDDESLLKFIEAGIEQLNNKYNNGEKKFFVFHRKRLWNEAENKWIGWERKRGKIHEFNRYLRGADDTSFILAPPHYEVFNKINYVITCDSDTRLPRGSVKKLLGTILHPLNQPQIDTKTGRVIQGYGILQPRISITPESSERSWFARIFSGHTGIDPYTTAVSDIYQDLFAEGIYTGKGLYVVDSFENALQNRVPENTLLSHDLFEGLFARTALVTDIEFLDDYPSHYLAFAKRQHRWTRGDWQILTWLFSKVPDGQKKWIENTLPFVSRWKIFDNLRRSLVAPLTFLWLILGWTLLPGPAIIWTLIAIAILAFPAYAHATNNLLLHPRGIPWTSHFWSVWGDVRTHTAQMVLSIAFIPHQAYLQLDAVVRSLYRKYISQKHLLEWQTAADVESSLPNGMSRYLLWPPILTSVLLLSFLFFFHPTSIYSAIPFLVLWSIFPVVVHQISKVRLKPQIILEENDILQLRIIARKTWNFFETFVTEVDNWLIPDNFQEIPKPTVAHRTSPTNMGLLLLSTCSAFDLGYIGPFEMIERLEKTLKTMLKMEKQFGHFYNWYETKTLQPLFPEYISTVDSGNLAGHLIAVKQSCLALKQKDLFPSQVLNGLHDTLEIVIEKIKLLNPVLRESKSFGSNYLQSQLMSCLVLTRSNSFSSSSSYHQPLSEIVNNLETTLRSIESLEHFHGEDHYLSLKFWLIKSINMCKSFLHLFEGFKNHVLTQEELNKRCDQLAGICNDLVSNMNFSVLFSKQRKIFTIGYNVRDGKPDNSYYDLLASESRLASFIAIAKGDVPQSHWFHLGRQMTSVFKQRVLISWSASMFEYLMPLLVMRDYPDTLLNETHYSVIKQQIFYGKKQGIPWGISESGYNARDLQMNYQYGPFGIPGMGLKRGLVDDMVISPYSTALAAIISPKEALNNFKNLIKCKLLTDFGFYEAVDYTSERIQTGQGNAIVQNFMAHHQGMILVAFNNVINDNLMQNRFHQDLMVRSSELLLQECTPKKVTISHPRAEEVRIEKSGFFDQQPSLRQIKEIDSPFPITQILSNGGYTVMLSAVGSGFSQRESIALTRWHGDACIDSQGFYIYIEDGLSGSCWSSTLQPMNVGSQFYKTTFSEHKAEFWCHKEELVSHTEVIISAEDNVELRKITLTNFSKRKRNLNITSYLEPILTPQEADLAHPAFNKLFIETEYIKSKSALLARRRKRSHDDPEIWGIHLVTWSDENKAPIQYETDRNHFLGRGRDLSKPTAIKESRPLSNTVGATLDPIFSLRKQVSLSPQETIYLCFVSGVTDSRDDALRLIDQYHDLHAFNREDEMAWTKCQAELRHLNINYDEAECYQKLGNALLFPNGPLRAIENIPLKNSQPQSSLWAYGVSGDLPILMVKIKSKHEISLIKQLLHAHEYLRLKDIRTDLVVLNAESSSYRQALHDELNHQVRMAGQQALLNRHGGIFLLKEDSVPEKDINLFKTTARAYLDAEKGPLKDQLDRLSFSLQAPKIVKTQRVFPFTDRKHIPLQMPELQFYNGYGGFTQGGKEYVLYLKPGQKTPAPWVNVIANDQEFGFLVSERGSTCTWSINSRENRITPWNNDPLSDPSGENFYIHDLESGELWSPTPAPHPGPEAYLIRHGQGYSQFENNNYELKQKLVMFCLMNKEIKMSQIKFKNESSHTRKLSVTYYLELVLGHSRSKTIQHIVTEPKEELNAILAHNTFNEDFGDRVTFVSSSENIYSFTCDRREFIGRHGNYRHPDGLKKESLSNNKSVNSDPCIAIQVEVVLTPKQEKTVSFVLGQVSSHESIPSLLNDIFKKEDNKLLEVKQYWKKILENLQVQTPFPEFDVLVNRWLLYQNLSCRLWGRTAFYQSGGAFGFRDQLQDVTSLLHTVPDLARSHILKAASHQFIEGDVLHWWHPPTGKGVRTHFSDDLLWLPYVVSTYIKVTGDQSILEEIVPFIEGPELSQDKEDLYFQPKTSQVTGTLYEHCIKAIDRSLRLGKHDLPLMGTGDWNDGMNQVGAKGEGESVWMAWFLISILKSFSKFCEQRNEDERYRVYQNQIKKLNEAVETYGWDGEWYKRAYFDDGSPLGSKENDECKVDSLTQSWAALSGTANKDHLKSALNSINKFLVNEEEQLVLLFTPPFDKTALNPGYIKGYVPGVRENGGQYTHAAIWAAQAFAAIGDGELALKLMSYLNPINHTRSIENVQKYKVEPYVIPADVYTASGHLGRGGWTWYTGSASWFYRSFTESILGIYRCGDKLEIQPCLPNAPIEYKIKYRFGSSTYNIQVKVQPSVDQSNQAIIIDGKPQEQTFILLKDENKSYEVQVNISPQMKRELSKEFQMKM